MCAPHTQRQTLQFTNMLARVLVVEPVFAGHGLAGGGNGAGCAEGPEEVEGCEGGDGAAGCYGCCLRED
jgi:hypothetical protein